LLESVLSLVAVLCIFIGILDVGQLLFLHETLAERVRSAASYGARTAYDAASIRNVVLYGVATPSAGQRSFFNLTSSMVSVERQGAGTVEDRIVVGVSRFPVRFYTPGFARLAQGIPIFMVAAYEGGG
jgi:hypothetical protein